MPIDRNRVSQPPQKDKMSQQPNEQQKVFGGKNYNQFTGFANYFSQEKAQKLVDQNIAFHGVLEVQPTNYLTGMVKTDNGNFVIPTRSSLNRALHGDKVVVIPLEKDKSETSLANWSIAQKSAGQDITVTKAVTQGFVIFISEVIASRSYEAMLDPIQNNPNIVRFQPVDRRFPSIDVPNTFGAQLPKPNDVFLVEITEWVQQNYCPNGVLVDAKPIREIELDNLNNIADFVMQANGVPYNYRDKSLDEKILSDIQLAEQQLLNDTGLDRSQVFQTDIAVLQNLQQQIDHLNSQEKVFKSQNRRSFVNDLVFTIDPDTAKDFDDSTHINFIDSVGKIVSFKDFCDMSGSEQVDFKKSFRGYEVGVHIADVTHYVQHDSKLDQMALTTTTSVYITDRCCPMLPFQLADGLCSLNPAVPRYTYSLTFQIDKNGFLLPQTVWFGKGIILSHARLDYVCAQKFIEKKYNKADIQDTSFFDRWPVANGYQAAVILAVQEMDMIAKHLRTQRKNLGSLQMSSDELRWKINESLQVSINPPEEASDAHHLIEEFMVIANTLIAMRLVASFPSCSSLRQHPPPKSKFEYQDGLKDLKLPGINLTGGVVLLESIEKLSKQLEHLYGKRIGTIQTYDKDQYFKFLTNNFFMSNGLMRAKYIAGMSTQAALLAHWGIHSQLYMHFTSPIRRYADDICHRLLTAALELERGIDFSNYISDPLYAYVPHRLIFTEKTSIYAYDGCLPPIDFQKLCDKLEPLDDFEGQTTVQQGSDSVIGILDDIQSGKAVITRKQKVKDRIQKAVDMIVENGEEFYDQVHQRQAQRDVADEEVNKDSLAYKAYEIVNQNLDLVTTYKNINELRYYLTKCNEMAKLSEMVEDSHHKIMLRFFIQQQIAEKKVQHLETLCFLISAKKGKALFSIPEFGLSIDMSVEINEELSTKSQFVVKMDKSVSFSEQNGDEDNETEVMFVLLEPFKVKLLPGILVTDGMLVYLADDKK